MFPRLVFNPTFRFFCGKPDKILSVSAALFFSFILCVSQAQGYGFCNGEAPPIQQAPPPQTEPGAQLFFPLIAGGASSLDHDERPSQPSISVTGAAGHTGDSDTPPPEGNRYTFVTDSGGHLDGYWFRNDLPDGQLKFTIEITSPTVSWLNVDSQGFLTQDAVDTLARRGVMPHEAELTLQVFDVDHDAEMVCPERDYVRINGKQITLPNESAPAVLRSGHAQWSEWKVYFPVTYLKFPVAYPYGGDPTLGFNEIAIEVNAECQTNGWAVKIDWGSIALRPNLTSPIVFIPGWTGKMDTFQEFAQQASDDGYQAFNIPSDEYLNRGIATTEETAHQVLFLIERALTNTGAKKVFIVAHSRGGIFVRQTLRMYQSLAPFVAGYLTISTVHHGTDLVKYIDGAICSQFSDELAFLQCSVAARTLMTAPLRAFNYGEACSHMKVVLRKLFELSADYASQLDSGDLSQALKDEFALHGIVDAQIERRQPGLEWAIASGTKRYTIHQGCFLGGCLLYVYLLTPVNEATDEISQPPLPYVDDYWINCSPQWKNGEAIVPSYSVSSSELPCGDVGLKEATFPWRADDVPFPHSANIDGEFCIDHLRSNSAPEIYTYVLDRLASTVQPSSAQAAASSQLEPEPLAQPLFSVSGILAPGAAPTFTVPIENVVTATFHVFANPHVSVTETPTATATDLPTLMPTPTSTPSPTITPTLASPSLLHLSSSGSGNVGGVSFAGADILTYNRTTSVWAMLFDGSDVGVTIHHSQL